MSYQTIIDLRMYGQATGTVFLWLVIPIVLGLLLGPVIRKNVKNHTIRYELSRIMGQLIVLVAAAGGLTLVLYLVAAILGIFIPSVPPKIFFPTM